MKILIMVIIMKYKSIWKDTKINIKYPKLDSNKNFDILVIGGGLTGISTIYNLKDSNLKVCLVEKNKIGFGVTSNSTGKLTFLQDNVLYKIKDKDLYLKSQLEAINIAKHIIEENNIKCDFTKTKSFLFSTKDSDIEKIKDIKNMLIKNNINVSEEKPPIIDTNYSICVNDTYIFNPIKYIYHLLPKLNNIDIFEDTRILNIYKDNGEYVCETDNYSIKSKKVVIASHYPYFLLPYFFPIKCKLERSYLSASKYKIDPVSAISYSKPTISFRTYKDYFIYLNGSHILCNKLDYNKNFEILKSDLNKLNLIPSYLWSNKDIITNDYLPYIGSIKDGLIIATGYNTWGMTNSILAGKIVSDIILEKKNDYLKLFNPKRNNNLNVLVDCLVNIKAYISSAINKNDNIKYVKIDGKRVAVYKDENGSHFVYTKCPHLKCDLIFNEIEKTWDCPCHGSRFAVDGNCIEGPSNYNITYKE